jgi:hypothetical protein
MGVAACLMHVWCLMCVRCAFDVRSMCVYCMMCCVLSCWQLEKYIQVTNDTKPSIVWVIALCSYCSVRITFRFSNNMRYTWLKSHGCTIAASSHISHIKRTRCMPRHTHGNGASIGFLVDESSSDFTLHGINIVRLGPSSVDIPKHTSHGCSLINYQNKQEKPSRVQSPTALAAALTPPIFKFLTFKNCQ